MSCGHKYTNIHIWRKQTDQRRQENKTMPPHTVILFLTTTLNSFLPDWFQWRLTPDWHRKWGQQRAGQSDVSVLRQRHTDAEDVKWRYDKVCHRGEFKYRFFLNVHIQLSTLLSWWEINFVSTYLNISKNKYTQREIKPTFTVPTWFFCIFLVVDKTAKCTF